MRNRRNLISCWRCRGYEAADSGADPTVKRAEKRKHSRWNTKSWFYQINPHFLLNVLNSIQWMAQMSHQKDIGEYTSALKKLLSYNLGKEGRKRRSKEIEMVKIISFCSRSAMILR